MDDSKITQQIEGWQKAMNQAFSSFHAAAEAVRHAQIYGVGIIIRDEDGICSAAEPHKYFIHLYHEGCTLSNEDKPEEQVKEPDHGEVVMYRFTFQSSPPQFIPPAALDFDQEQGFGARSTMEQEAVTIQAIYEDGFIVVVKNRYGKTSGDRQ